MINKKISSLVSVALLVIGAICSIASSNIFVAAVFYITAFIIYLLKETGLPKTQEDTNPLPAPFSKFSLDLILSAALFIITCISVLIVILKYKERIFDSENNISDAQIIFFMVLPLLAVLSASILIFIKKEKWLFFPFAIILLMFAVNNYYSVFALSGYFIMLWEAFNILSNRPSLPKFWIIYAIVAVLYSAFAHSSIDFIGTNPVDFIIPNLNIAKLKNDVVVDALLKGAIAESNAADRILDRVNEIPLRIAAIKMPLRIAFSLAFVMYLKWVLFQKRIVKEFLFDESEYESEVENENIPENSEDAEKQRTYSSALKKMKTAQNEYDFTESAELFASVEGYKNAKLLSEKCREFSEKARVFNNAQDRMRNAKTVSEWKELSNIFASIRGFKDSDALSKECSECANALLEANSLRPAPKPKTSPKTQKIILISIIAFVVVCSAAGFFVYQQKQEEERQAFLEEIRRREIEREEEIRKENERLKEERQREEEERRKEEERQAEIRKRNAVPQNLASIAKYLNLYGESKTNYAEKCPEQIQNLASALSGRMTYEELLKIINKEPSDLDGKHYTKVSDIASPQSVAKQKQAHKDYVPILVNDKTVKKGLEFFDEYRDTILRAYRETGVKPEDILGVLNWESKFGEYKGTFSVYQIFMGQICYLPEIEQNHFESGAYASKKVMKRPNALKRLEKLKKKSVENMAALISMAMDKHFNFYEIQGSWAGAIGIPQFMPSSMNFAADGDGDGEIDLNNMHDAIFSVATYLEQHGYKEQGAKHAFMAYNPEEMYVRGVSLYSQKIVSAGLRY